MKQVLLQTNSNWSQAISVQREIIYGYVESDNEDDDDDHHQHDDEIETRLPC